MQAHDIMVKPVYKVKEDDTVRNFIEKCVEHRISGSQKSRLSATGCWLGSLAAGM